MQRCPVEILSAFFEHACTDGGQTAASLRTVSRHFAQVSQPFRFRTISVTGAASLAALVNALSNANETSLRGAQHLFIAELDRHELDDGIEEDDNDVAARKMDEKRMRKHARKNTALIRTVLTQLAPHIRTLTLFFATPSSTDRRLLRNTNFPLLTDLALHTPSVGYGNLTTIHAPSLRALRIHQSDRVGAVSGILPIERYSYQCPALVLVVVEGLRSECFTPHMQNELAEELFIMRMREKPGFRPSYHLHILPAGLEDASRVQESLRELSPRTKIHRSQSLRGTTTLYDEWADGWSQDGRTVVDAPASKLTSTTSTIAQQLETYLWIILIFVYELLLSLMDPS